MPYILFLIIGILIFTFLYRGRFEHMLLINKILERSHDGYWFYYINSDKSWWSDQNYHLLGLDNYSTNKNKHFFPSLVHPDYYDKFITTTQQDSYEIIIPVKHSNGSYLWIQTNGAKYTIPFIKKEVVIGFNRDVSDLYEIAHEVKYLAYHDRTTDTLNSEGFKRKLHELSLDSLDNSNSYILMLELELSHYEKEITNLSTSNIVQFVVNDLKKIFGHDKVARISEHGFTILSTKHNLSDLENYFKNLNNSLNNGVSLDNTTYYGGLQVLAIEMFPVEHYEQYLIYRDFVLTHHACKSEDIFTVVDSSIKARCLDSIKTRNEFLNGLKVGEVLLYFQPIINAKTNKISKLEALIRWNNPSKGILGPGAFLPYLNESHDIKQVDFWVIKEAIKTIAIYEEKGYNIPPISINVTGITLADENLVNYIRDELQYYQVLPSKLCVEVTEQILISNITIGNKNLDSLKAMGIQIVLDDFGTGYSSIHYINQLNAQVIKIDRSFIKDIQKNHKTQAIVNLIRNLAEELAVELIAEGIETSDELDFVLHHYCDLVQGYLISHPLPIETVLNLSSKYYDYTELHSDLLA